MKSANKFKKLIWFFGALLCVGSCLVLWAFFIEPNLIRVHKVSVSIPNWNSDNDGIKIAVLTDLHVGSPFINLDKLKIIVSKTNECEPDVVILLGDLVIHGVLGGEFIEPEKITALLKELRSPIGTVAVLGNHDWWYDGPRVAKAMAKEGILVLENNVFKATLGNGSFWLAGLADMWTRDPKISLTLEKITDENPVILLTHNPDIFPEIPSNVSLTLAGHTHGGQVNLPLMGRPIVPSKFGQRFAAGHIIEEGRHMFVGTGIGTSILPVRFRVRPEILLLTLICSS